MPQFRIEFLAIELTASPRWIEARRVQMRGHVNEAVAFQPMQLLLSAGCRCFFAAPGHHLEYDSGDRTMLHFIVDFFRVGDDEVRTMFDSVNVELPAMTSPLESLASNGGNVRLWVRILPSSRSGRVETPNLARSHDRRLGESTLRVEPRFTLRINGQGASGGAHVVVVGERVLLEVDVEPAQDNAFYCWSLDGVAVASYVASDEGALVDPLAPLTDLTGKAKTSVTFHWVDGGNARVVGCTVISAGVQYFVFAQVDVVRPEVDARASELGMVLVSDRFARRGLHLGIGAIIDAEELPEHYYEALSDNGHFRDAFPNGVRNTDDGVFYYLLVHPKDWQSFVEYLIEFNPEVRDVSYEGAQARDSLPQLQVQLAIITLLRRLRAVDPSDVSAEARKRGFVMNHFNPGFSVMARVRSPQSGALIGTWTFVQLVRSRRTRLSREGELDIKDTGGAYWLDNDYPYIDKRYAVENVVHRTNDSPRDSIGPQHVEVSVRDDFLMYVVFRPGSDGAIEVPLAVIRWGWRAIAKEDEEGQPDIVEGTRKKHVRDAAPTTCLPVWSQVIKNVSSRD